MSKKVALGIAAVCLGLGAFAQVNKEFSLENLDSCDHLDISLRSVASNTTIRSTNNLQPLNIFASSMSEDFNPQFISYRQGTTRFVQVREEQDPLNTLGRTLTNKMLSDAGSDNNWQVYLSNTVPLNLSLSYMVGNATVDMSGLPIQNITMKVGSADVDMMYERLVPNPTELESFDVEVDMGTLTVSNMELLRAKRMKAQVGFGALTLEYGGAQDCESTVRLAVGAGDLVVRLPSQGLPVLINLNNTMLCKVHMLGNFRRIRHGVYVNDAYQADASNIVTFDASVAMGSLSFEEK